MIIKPISRPLVSPLGDPLRSDALPWEPGGGGSAPFNPLTAPSLFALYRETTVDAGGGACSEWTDLAASGTYDAVQGTALAQPTIAAADSDLNSQPSLSFDGGDRLTVTAGAAADWTCLHDDSDLTAWIAFYSASAGATQTLLSTFISVSANNIGAVLRYDGTSENVDIFTGSGGGGTSQPINVSSAVGSVARGAPHFLVFRKNADGWELWIDGALALAGEYANAVSTGAPQSRLVIGATAAPTAFLTGKMAEVGFARAYLDAAAVSAYGVARY